MPFDPAVERWRGLVRRYAPPDLRDDPEFQRIVLATIQAESGGRADAPGDYENGRPHSIGLFQLHDGGMGAGLSVAQRSNPELNASRAVPALAASYRASRGDPIRTYIQAINPGARPTGPQVASVLAAYRQGAGGGGRPLAMVDTGGAGVDTQGDRPPSSFESSRGAQATFDQIIAAKGDPTGIKVLDPTIKGTGAFGRPGAEVPNPTPTYELTFKDGTQIRARTSQSGQLELFGGTAQTSVAAAQKPPTKPPGTLIGGQTPNEQYIVTVNPDGTISQQPNPNYVPPIRSPTAPRTVPTSANEQYIVRENPDGTITTERNPNYVPPKPGRTTHTVGGRAFTLDEDGNVVGSVDLRTPQQVRKEDIDLTRAEQELLPAAQRILQGHQDTVEYLRGMYERGEIDMPQMNAYVASSKAAAQAALRGTNPFDEMKEERRAREASQGMGIDLLNQRLVSGTSLASSLMNAATNPRIMLRPGQASLGIDPLAGLGDLVGELQGGPQIAPYARGLLMGAQQAPPGVPAPLMAGL